jgi:hypothetical protein
MAGFSSSDVVEVLTKQQVLFGKICEVCGPPKANVKISPRMIGATSWTGALNMKHQTVARKRLLLGLDAMHPQ